ncbi:cellulose synthase operon protein YhjQ [bacterium]|nr:cellulose synthase operon protein YhjQ [bacterium]
MSQLNNKPDAFRIAVVSPKGGVGKTTLTANLADALSLSGYRSLAVDLDPQNALQFHLRSSAVDANGLAAASLSRKPWPSAITAGRGQVSVLPFGYLADRHRVLLESRLAPPRNPAQWMHNGLLQATEALGDVDFVLMDTPPGPSVYQQAAIGSADMVLIITLADAASFITVPGIDRLLSSPTYQPLRGQQSSYFVINRMNTARVLGRDVRQRLQQRLGERLSPVAVHFDASAEEALAAQETAVHYAPDSRAAHDVAALAQWVLRVAA